MLKKAQQYIFFDNSPTEQLTMQIIREKFISGLNRVKQSKKENKVLAAEDYQDFYLKITSNKFSQDLLIFSMLERENFSPCFKYVVAEILDLSLSHNSNDKNKMSANYHTYIRPTLINNLRTYMKDSFDEETLKKLSEIIFCVTINRSSLKTIKINRASLKNENMKQSRASLKNENMNDLLDTLPHTLTSEQFVNDLIGLVSKDVIDKKSNIWKWEKCFESLFALYSIDATFTI